MCGIIGAIAHREIEDILVTGLKALEYRGYDSAGVCACSSANFCVIKSVGKVANLEQTIQEYKKKQGVSSLGEVGIAHTRWATHGSVCVENAHPHIVDSIALVHNGIIENYKELKAQLAEQGYSFYSQTDSEVLATLIYSYKQQGLSCFDAIRAALKKVVGSYAIAVLDREECKENACSCIYVAKHGSPLVVGVGIKENFIASDPLALSLVTSSVIHLEDNDCAKVTQENIEIFSLDGVKQDRLISLIHYQQSANDKGHFKHYMQKEIFEQPDALRASMTNALTQDDINTDLFFKFAPHKNVQSSSCDCKDTTNACLCEKGGAGVSLDILNSARKSLEQHNKDSAVSDLNSINLESIKTLLKDIKHVELVACGTSYHAAMVGKYYLEEFASLSANVTIASEYRYKKTIVPKNSLFITLSQSGETADTLGALELAKTQGYLVSLCICNVPYSNLVNKSDLVILTKAGVEIGVASTKAFTTQLLALFMLTLGIGRANGNITSEKGQNIVKAIKSLPIYVEKALKVDEKISLYAQDFIQANHALFLGRGIMFPIALEGALKLKEISYIHAEGYAAGELKHGPIALIDHDMPVFALLPDNDLKLKIKSNLEEVQARGGKLYLITDINDKENKENVLFKEQQDKTCKVLELDKVPDFIVPIVFTVPLQLFAYHVALCKGTDVDQPRNLAKSVTVE